MADLTKICRQCNIIYEKGAYFCNRGHILFDKDKKDEWIGQTLKDRRYELAQRLGSGGFGLVYLAVDHHLNDRAVVIKLAREEYGDNIDFQKAFRKEIKAMSKVSGDFTAKIYDWGETDRGQVFLVQEYLRGETLEQLLKKTRKLEPKKALYIAKDIAAALHDIHKQNILHRDIKPSNIMIITTVRGERAKVFDFGIAKILDETKSKYGTQSEGFSGTIVYASPEQCYCKKELIGPPTDIYAFGAVIYEMLSGYQPYLDKLQLEEFDNEVHFMVRVAAIKNNEDPTPLSSFQDANIPPDMENLVMRMLAINPDRRPQSAEEVLRTLEEIENRIWGGHPIDIPANVERKWILPIALAVGVVGGAVMGLLYLSNFQHGLKAINEKSSVVERTNDIRSMEVEDAGYVAPVEEVIEGHQSAVKISKETVRLLVRSDPPGALVFIAGTKVGTTPLDMPIEKGGKPISIELFRRGYIQARRQIIPDHDRTIELVLKPLPKREQVTSTPEHKRLQFK